MRFQSIAILAGVSLLASALPALAMPEGDHMMKKPKMSKQDMKKLAACKSMDQAMALKKRGCAKLMKAEEMSMQPSAMEHKGDHAM